MLLVPRCAHKRVTQPIAQATAGAERRRRDAALVTLQVTARRLLGRPLPRCAHSIVLGALWSILSTPCCAVLGPGQAQISPVTARSRPPPAHQAVFAPAASSQLDEQSAAAGTPGVEPCTVQQRTRKLLPVACRALHAAAACTALPVFLATCDSCCTRSARRCARGCAVPGLRQQRAFGARAAPDRSRPPSGSAP